jgi:hypothetical protein
MEETKNFYTNAVSVLASLYDVTLQFKTQVPIGTLDPNKIPAIEVTDQFYVRMSPQHAKALAVLLLKNVQDYESQFQTKLVLPPEMEQMWADLIGSGK